MYELDAERFWRIASILVSMRNAYQMLLQNNPPEKINELKREGVEQILLDVFALRNDLAQMGLNLSCISLDRLLQIMRRPHKPLEVPGNYVDAIGYWSMKEEEGAIGEFLQRVQDEMRGRKFISLDLIEAVIIKENENWLDKSVFDCFPLIREDAEQASKSLALGLYTASVFHMMRMMEGAVQVIAKRLGVSGVERVWGVLLSDIGKKIEAMPKGEERSLWSQSHSLLYHVKEAWRNDTMHPKKTYTQAEAFTIRNALNSYFSNLANLLLLFP